MAQLPAAGHAVLQVPKLLLHLRRLEGATVSAGTEPKYTCGGLHETVVSIWAGHSSHSNGRNTKQLAMAHHKLKFRLCPASRGGLTKTLPRGITLDVFRSLLGSLLGSLLRPLLQGVLSGLAAQTAHLLQDMANFSP